MIDLLKEYIIYKSSNSFKGLKQINDINCNDLLEVTNKKAFKMIDVLVEALSSYRKAGSAKVLFEIACLKMCELNDTVIEKVVYKEVVKEQEVQTAPVQQVVVEKKESINEIIKEETVQTVKSEETKTTESVSRETEQEQPKIEVRPMLKNNIPSEEELLNVLVQATKDDLVKAKQQWVMLPKYLNSAATAKVTGILLDGYPLAACNNVIIIGYNNEVYLNRVYQESNYDEMNSLLKALYNNDVKCYCVTLQMFTELKEKYMALRQLGKLPKPVPIIIQRRNINIADNSSTIVDEEIEYAKKLFGDNLIIQEGE